MLQSMEGVRAGARRGERTCAIRSVGPYERGCFCRTNGTRYKLIFDVNDDSSNVSTA